MTPSRRVERAAAGVGGPAQRALRRAPARRGDGGDVAEMLDMTPSGARQHLTGLADAGLLEAGEAARAAGPAGPQRAVLLHRPGGRAAVPAGLRRADQPAARLRAGRRGDGGVRAPARRPHRGGPGAAGAAGAASRPRSPSWPGSSTRTATWPRSSRSATARYRIAERNCAIFAVAREHPQACSTELEFLRAALPEADDRAGHPHDGRRPLLQLRGPPPLIHPSVCC